MLRRYHGHMPRLGTTSGQRAASPFAARGAARALERKLRDVVDSAEPAVVLSSLARCCSTCFCDMCAIELSEGTEDLFRIRFPMADDDSSASGHGASPRDAALASAPGLMVAATEFRAPSGHGYPAFAGVVTYVWYEHEPTESDAMVARLLVDRALAIVGQQRLAESATQAEARAAKLAIELITSRAEGEATGILMAKHRVTSHEALQLLRQLSRTSRHSLDRVAADVIRAAGLDAIPRHGTAGPPQRGHLQVAAPHGGRREDGTTG